MSTTPASASPTPSSLPSKPTNKSQKSRIITLRVPSSVLARFPSDVAMRKASKSKPPVPSKTSSPAPPIPIVELTPAEEDKAEETSTATLTLENANDVAASHTEGNGVKRKDLLAGAPRGRKPALDEFGNPKPRGKPGPKKRKGVEGENGSAAPVHKLGPKANQGAINAQLRALDRTGKLSRRWQRSGFQFCSFTGTRWELSQWNTPKLEIYEGDVQSEHIGSSDQARNELPSSQVPSERSHYGDGGTPAVPMDVASSPLPQPADAVMAT